MISNKFFYSHYHKSETKENTNQTSLKSFDLKFILIITDTTHVSPRWFRSMVVQKILKILARCRKYNFQLFPLPSEIKIVFIVPNSYCPGMFRYNF